jgi:DNA-binding protein H-NS
MAELIADDGKQWPSLACSDSNNKNPVRKRACNLDAKTRGVTQVKLGNADFYLLSADELWSLHEEVGAVLSQKIVAEKRELEERLARLNRGMADRARLARAESGRRRVARRKYPPVLPKYQNPNDPSETWAGRGKQPRWLVSELQAGRNMSDFLIDGPERQSAGKRP